MAYHESQQQLCQEAKRRKTEDKHSTGSYALRKWIAQRMREARRNERYARNHRATRVQDIYAGRIAELIELSLTPHARKITSKRVGRN